MAKNIDIAKLQGWFEASETSSHSARKEGERARDYIDGNQLTAEQRATLKKRGQPDVVVNRVRRKVEWLKGLEVQSRTDPRAFPRTPQHQQGAEAATDAIRYVCDNADWDSVRSDIYDNMLVEGFGGCEVVHKVSGTRRAAMGGTSMTPAEPEVEIVINQYPWDRLFYDPHSRRADFSDARYLGAVLWMDEEDFLADFEDRKGHLEALYSATSTDTYDDKPADVWVDPKRKRVRVVLIWYRHKNEWHWAKFIRGDILDGGLSIYVDENGDTVCPLIMQSAFVGRNLDRYGLLRDMFDIQDEVNARRSKALFGVTMRQTIGLKGAVDSVAGMKRELASPDGHIEINPEVAEDAARLGMRPVDILPTNDQLGGQFELLQEAKNEIDMLGANAALAGEGERNSSGRAVMAKQQGGMIELASLNDRLHQLTREVYRHIWMRIRQFWREEKWVRVTDDERNVRFVGLNRMVTLEEQLGRLPPEQAQQIALGMGLYPGDPRLQQPVGVDNRVEEIDVDILIEEVPDQITLQGETFEQIVNIANVERGVVPPDVLVEAAPGLRRDIKDKLLERIEQRQAGAAQTEEIQSQLGAAQAQAEVKKTESEAVKNMASAQKTMTEAQAPIVNTAAGF